MSPLTWAFPFALKEDAALDLQYMLMFWCFLNERSDVTSSSREGKWWKGRRARWNLWEISDNAATAARAFTLRVMDERAGAFSGGEN